MARTRQTPTRRSRHVAAGLLAAALTVSTAVSGAAVPVDELPTVLDGTYTGRVAISGSFGIAESGVQITWTGSIAGPATLTIDGGAANGTVSGNGNAVVSGTIAGLGTVSGQQTVAFDGAITGAAGEYSMDTTATTTAEISVEIEGFGTQTRSDTFTDSGSVPITDLLRTCDQLMGRFDRPIKQALQDIGFTETLRGTISLVREPTTDATEEALDDLQDAMTTALDWIDQIGSSDVYPAAGVGTLIDVVLTAAEVAASLEGPHPCPASQQDYLESAADVALRALEAILAADDRGVSISADALRRVVTAGLATGITGRSEGEDVLQEVHDTVDERWLDIWTGPGDFVGDSEAYALIVLAAQMGWDLPLGDGNSIAASDVLTMLGPDGGGGS